ncbi:60S ribosomal protein L30 [Hondaea fermentalgiana]|uniref:60S ribosomal protein L30 n=1 Tax=Hondaea fermentalgiana TaxID=2315210 RepID=A0A2R5G598_9STRA|nr:60S ribosomal protein L30 [Hondaea fermentalgiana]|eukprot:GBG26150.1 60S ribosomal protein L30 [Hondaea fermentalgiana]
MPKQKKKSQENLNSKLALVMKSGKYSLGYKSTIKSLRNGKAKLIILSNNTPPLRKSEVEYYAMLAKCNVTHFNGNNTDLGLACGRYFRVSMVSITDPGDSDIASALRQREQTNAMLMGLGTVQLPAKYAQRSAPSRQIKAVQLEPPAVGRLRDKIAGRGLYGMHDLTRLLRVMDENGDGVLTCDELKYGLEDLGVRVNDAEIVELFQYFDRDNSGAISQQEFLRGVRGPLPKSRESCILDVFASLDKTRDGCVTLDDIELAFAPSQHPLVRSGQQTAAQALRDFLRRWDHLEDDTEVTLAEFLEYHKNLSATISDDQEFVALVRGLWRLDTHEDTKEHGRAGLQSNQVDISSFDASENAGALYNAAPANAPRGPGRPEAMGKAARIYESQSTRAQRHPDAPRPGKPSVPKWIRFDGVSLGFSLYHKETTREHTGRFNAQTRVFDTQEQESFRIRTFVLRYFLEDDTVAVSETTASQQRSLQFMGRTPSPLQLRDLAVGNTVTLKGLPMHVADADAKARTHMKQVFPDLQMREALLIPQDPLTQQESIQKQHQETSHKQAVRAPSAPSAQTTSRKFIENDGKVMQFLCTWNDPGLVAGDSLRKFKLLYYLSDDTLELREVNERNSGRERQALLNLNRQRLPNPLSTDCATYKPEDLFVGAIVNAFGRAMRVVDCDVYAKRYLAKQGLPSKSLDDESTTGAMRQTLGGLQGAPPPTEPLGLYSDAVDQKLSQIIGAIRATTEQRTRFGNRFDQRRMLRAYLKRFADADPERSAELVLDREGFASAMAGFSCFGSDCELLFEHLQRQQKEQHEAQRRQGNRWEQPTEPHDIAAQVIIDAVYGPGEEQESQAAGGLNEVDDTDVAVSETRKVLGSRVEGLIRAIKDKLEVSTNFGEVHQQKRALLRILQKSCVGSTASITRSQFRGAMAQLNCWERDAHALFDAFDSRHEERLACAALVDRIFAAT